MKKIIYCCIIIMLFAKVQAQNVTIMPNGITPAMGNNHPRISYEAMLALPSPQEGDLVFDTTFKCLRIYSDGKWLCSYQDPTNYIPNVSPMITFGGAGNDVGSDIAIDADGNIYMIGAYSETAEFVGTNLTSAGGYDIFVAKFTKTGALLWARSAGGTKDDMGFGIALDAGGNVYITGRIEDTATFGSTNVTSAGIIDIFIAKYTNNGDFQWVKSAGGTGSDYGSSLAVDGSGNIYLTGYFFNTATFGSFSVTAHDFESDAFFAKCNSNGVFQWVHSGGGDGADAGNGIAVDGIGNAYIAGYFQGQATFGTTNIPLSPQIGNDIFLVKYDPNGNFQWVKTAGNYYYDTANDVALDSEGNVYITGNYSIGITFGDLSITNDGSTDMFVAKFNGTGHPIWLKTSGGSGSGRGITASGNGVYVTGPFTGTFTLGTKTITSTGPENDILVVKYDKVLGEAVWTQTAGGTAVDSGAAVAVAGNGNVYAIGQYKETATFGKTTKISKGQIDGFVLWIDK